MSSIHQYDIGKKQVVEKRLQSATLVKRKEGSREFRNGGVKAWMESNE